MKEYIEKGELLKELEKLSGVSCVITEKRDKDNFVEVAANDLCWYDDVVSCIKRCGGSEKKGQISVTMTKEDDECWDC